MMRAYPSTSIAPQISVSRMSETGANAAIRLSLRSMRDDRRATHRQIRHSGGTRMRVSANFRTAGRGRTTD